MTGDGAAALVEASVATVGIDYLRIDSVDDHIPHYTSMRNDILVFEALPFRT